MERSPPHPKKRQIDLLVTKEDISHTLGFKFKMILFSLFKLTRSAVIINIVHDRASLYLKGQET